MRRERIHAVSSWRRGPPRYNCVLVVTDQSNETMDGMEIAQVRLLFSFKHSNGKTYECALIDWYSCLQERDGQT